MTQVEQLANFVERMTYEDLSEEAPSGRLAGFWMPGPT